MQNNVMKNGRCNAGLTQETNTGKLFIDTCMKLALTFNTIRPTRWSIVLIPRT